LRQHPTGSELGCADGKCCTDRHAKLEATRVR